MYLFAYAFSSRGQASPNSSALEKQASFSVMQKTPLEALLSLGKQENISFGIVLSDAALIRNEISLPYETKSIHEFVDEILITSPSYVATSSPDGIIDIASSERSNAVANYLFSSFDIGQGAGPTLVSERLWGDMQMQLDPKRTGYGGVLQVPQADKPLPAKQFKDSSIPSILDWVASHNGSMSWVIWPSPASLIGEPQYKLWNLVFYEQPVQHAIPCCLYLPKGFNDIAPGLKKRLEEAY